MGKCLQRWHPFVILVVAGGLVLPAQAQAGRWVDEGMRGEEEEWTSQIYPSTLPPIHPSTENWLAQTPLVQITTVRLEATEAGLQIMLETADGELAAPITTVSGNALIAEIPNAMLALPAGDEFQQFEPADGIALVQVTGLPNNRVQVVITGAEAAPIAEVRTAATGLTLIIAPGIAQADVTDEPLRVVVTGEEGSRYVEPTVTTGTRTDTPL